ncbi:MAG: NAD(P)-dependent oxidoreductase [Candidatus Kariarchaeaceae archaeon]
MNEKIVNVLFIFEAREELKEYLLTNLTKVTNLNLIFPEKAEEEEYLRHISKVEAIVGWRPSKELLLSAEKLKLFINPGVGVQHLIPLFREVNTEREKPIILVNGHGNTYFTATHAVALLLSLMNKIIPHHNWMSEGRWRTRDNDARSIPLRDRKIGLLGYGAVNKKVHRFMAGFQVEFAILRRTWENKNEELIGTTSKFTYEQLNEFFEEIDVLIVAVPLTSLTKEMIKKEQLRLLGERGIIVNVGRGEVINEKDLYWALNENIIAGAAIDVWYDYNPEEDEDGKKFPSSQPFHELTNVVLSPHRGASPMNDLQRWNEVVENIKLLAAKSDKIINLVDLELEY